MADESRAMLVVEKGLEEVSVIPLDRDVVTLGRDPNGDIFIDHPYVSRRHAQILLEQSHYQIKDLGSKNGTFLNGSRLSTAAHWVESGDRIELGQGQVILRFRMWTTTITLPAGAGDGTSTDIVVNSRSREVMIQGIQLEPPLSRKEFDTLELLYQRRGEACSKDDIAARSWSERGGGDVGDQEIEQCIRRLRLRVEPNPAQPQYILTVRGFGYRLAAE